MSEEKIPEWDRARREILSQLQGIWEEISKLTDWLWREERRIDHLEERIDILEKHYANLRRDVENTTGRRIRSIFKDHKHN